MVTLLLLLYKYNRDKSSRFQNRNEIEEMVEVKERCTVDTIAFEKLEGKLYEVFGDRGKNSIFRFVFVFDFEWENDDLVRYICGESFTCAIFWETLLRLCLSYEYDYGTSRMALKKAKASNKGSSQMASFR